MIVISVFAAVMSCAESLGYLQSVTVVVDQLILQSAYSSPETIGSADLVFDSTSATSK